MTAHAFAPGHVSGLFAVHDEARDALKKGSRGAGWCLDKGAHATVSAGDGRRTVDGHVADLAVTRAALGRLDPRCEGLDLDLHLDLPVGQGFGMSAAGTLAACLAAASLFDLEPERALEAAHAAEVLAGTGLGDAVASWQGGAELRLRPGCPPHGWIQAVPVPEGASSFLFCVVGDGIPTPAILRDEAWRQQTRLLGDAAVDRIVAARREAAWPAILQEAHDFSRKLGLMPAAMARLGNALPPGVQWGQAMLGRTLWATGPPAALAACRPTLEQGGKVLEARVDPRGARLERPPT